jgi:hypothetical protein
MTNFWYWLGNTASVIQILSTFPLLLTAWWFFVRARRYRRRIAEMEKALTARPMALAIGVAGTDISGQVKQFLESAGINVEVRSYTKQGGVTQKNIHHMLNEILRIKAHMTDEGVTEVHLFLACPLVFAVAVGAILDNWVPIKVYHLNRETGRYEFWTPLHKGFIPGLESTPLQEVLGGDV